MILWRRTRIVGKRFGSLLSNDTSRFSRENYRPEESPNIETAQSTRVDVDIDLDTEVNKSISNKVYHVSILLFIA